MQSIDTMPPVALNDDQQQAKLPNSAEIVVIGGGLAGAGAACMLAQAEREVLLLEREPKAADKICGEFLSTETQFYLRRLGLKLDSLGGHVTKKLRLIRHHKIVETALPFTGLGLSRRRLDEALLDHASQCGVTIRRGQRVSNISNPNNLSAMEVAIQGAGKVNTNTLLLATGKHDLRQLRRRPDNQPEDLVGFKMYFNVEPDQRKALAGTVELVLFPQGYAGLQQVEDGKINLCFLAERSWLQACGGNWEGLFYELLRTCPHLNRRLREAKALLPQPLSIYRVPYGFIYQASATDPKGLYRLGDQLAVISSFSGDGMGIALHTAALAANCYLSGVSADNYHRRLHRDIASQLKRASFLYRIGRWDLSQKLLLSLASLWPASLRIATSLTRVPPQALI